MTEKQFKPLTIEDLQVRAVAIDWKKLRQLINGLRALPNVSDMAIINTIAELDRMVQPFEANDATRARLVEEAAQLAESKKQLDVAAEIRRRGEIPADILNEIIDRLRGEGPVHPTCECPRCTAARERAALIGGSAIAQ